MERSRPNRFRKTHRLLDAAAFARVFDQAERSRDRLFTVLCRNNEREIARLGLAISKKHCRKATDRNRIKRVIRESFRHNTEHLAGLDVVVLNKVECAAASNPELFASLEKHWRRCARNAASGNR